MQSIRKPQRQTIIPSVIILAIALVTLLTGCGNNHAPSNSTAVRSSTKLPSPKLRIGIIKDENIARFSFGFVASDEICIISFGRYITVPKDNDSIFISDDMKIYLDKERQSSNYFSMTIQEESNIAYLDVPLRNFTEEPFYIHIHTTADYMYKVQRTGQYAFTILRCWSGKELLGARAIPYIWLKAFTLASKRLAAWISTQKIDLLVLSPGYSSKDWKRDLYKDPYPVHVTFGQQPDRVLGDSVDTLADPILRAYWDEQGRYVSIRLSCDMKSVSADLIGSIIREIVESIAYGVINEHLTPSEAPFSFVRVIEDRWYGVKFSSSMSTSKMLEALSNASETRYHDFNLTNIVETYKEENEENRNAY